MYHSLDQVVTIHLPAAVVVVDYNRIETDEVGWHIPNIYVFSNTEPEETVKHLNDFPGPKHLHWSGLYEIFYGDAKSDEEWQRIQEMLSPHDRETERDYVVTWVQLPKDLWPAGR